MASLLVPVARLERWLANFADRHGPCETEGALTVRAADGAVARLSGPFGLPVRLPFVPPELAWGLLVVRKGGFAVAAGTTPRPAVYKHGRRHVQGRTKAGGQSQQRFARRRDNQARQAYAAAADHAHRILIHEHPVTALVCGGDRTAVAAVLADPRLSGLRDKVTGPWLATPDPNAAVLRSAIADAWSVSIELDEPQDAGNVGPGTRP